MPPRLAPLPMPTLVTKNVVAAACALAGCAAGSNRQAVAAALKQMREIGEAETGIGSSQLFLAGSIAGARSIINHFCTALFRQRDSGKAPRNQSRRPVS